MICTLFWFKSFTKFQRNFHNTLIHIEIANLSWNLRLPAFKIRISIWSTDFRSSPAAFLTDSKFFKSIKIPSIEASPETWIHWRCRTKPNSWFLNPWPVALFWSSSLAVNIFSSFRHKIITFPPRINNSFAVSKPIPTFAPVITIVLPSQRFFLSEKLFNVIRSYRKKISPLSKIGAIIIQIFDFFEICFRNLLQGQSRWLRKRKILEHPITILLNLIWKIRNFFRHTSNQQKHKILKFILRKNLVKSWNLRRN